MQILFKNMHANMQGKTGKYAKIMQISLTLIDIKNNNYNLKKWNTRIPSV